MATIRLTSLSRLALSLAGAMMLSSLCLGAALAPASPVAVAARA